MNRKLAFMLGFASHAKEDQERRTIFEKGDTVDIRSEFGLEIFYFVSSTLPFQKHMNGVAVQGTIFYSPC